ncbi:MAG: EAL domain-containing protein [Hyphomicrobium sp.]|jgi:diguanylate cyclase (GGDEF)-like protein/PAS domain S-box-containing protein
MRRAAILIELILLVVAFIAAVPERALALNPIVVSTDQGRIEITTLGDLYEGRGDSLQVETAAGADGLTGRMSVAATTPGTNPNWIVFALTNPTDKPIERWLTADRYAVIGSGAVWPDLDARRIETVTPSIGFVPERIKSDRADLFRITLEPGQTITYVAELSSERFARLHLWKPLEYELKISDRQLFNGIMLGLTGLLAIFLTAIFAANHKVVFPAAALVAWCALAYLCVDFGFFHKLFNMKPEANAVYRAAAESALAASLVVFLHVFLRLAAWHGLVRMLISVWLLAQFSLVAVAIIDPRLAATFARLSFVFIGATGAGLILFLAVRGQDRALSLIPTWLLFLVWIFGAGVTLTGQLSGDVVVSGLVAGLVLILLLIGFTVTQYAFRSIEPVYGATPSELQTRSIAVDASGAAVWEWNVRRDEVKVSPLVEAWLGLSPGELNARTDDFVKHLHPLDRERFRLALFAVQERRDGRLACEFRIRQADNSYRWFELEGAGVPGSDPRSLKCIGLLRDITDAKRAHERLLHDAVRDSLTGLPNRELILDRLAVAVARARSEPQIRPTVLTINIDKFTSVNSSLGLVLGDSLLLTIARRLQRHVGPNDTLARLGGDQFAILTLSEQPVAELAQNAERIRRSLRSPIKIAGQEIVLTGSLGIAVYEGEDTSHDDLLKKSEIAMFRAKRAGADRIEVFTPEMRGDQDERRALEGDLRKVLEKNQLRLFYQPVVYLPTEELAGFVALPRWEHPTLGLIDPIAFVPLDDRSDMIVKLGAHMLVRAARDASNWQKEHMRGDAPLFVLVNISCWHLFQPESIQELRHALGRNQLPKGTLKIEISEQLLLENPEKATEVLELLRGAGAEIALDGFGTGYSSLPYLEKLPFDTVKLDQGLLQASSGQSKGDAVLVRSLVAVAREMGKAVVAKGVEAQGDVSFLRSIGCDYAEGPYCGEPIPEGEVSNVLSLVSKSERKLKPRAMFRTKPQRKGPAQPATPERAAKSLAVQPASATAQQTGQQVNATGPAVANRRVRGQSPLRGNGAAFQIAAPAPAAAPQIQLGSVAMPGPSSSPGLNPSQSMSRSGSSPAQGEMRPAAGPANGPVFAQAPSPQPPSPPPPQVQAIAPAGSHISRIADVLPPVPSSEDFTPLADEPLVAPVSLQMLAAQLEKSAPSPLSEQAPGAARFVPESPPAIPPPLPPQQSHIPAIVPASVVPPPLPPTPQPFQPHQHSAPPRPAPDFSGLPPSIAESLARLAGNTPRKPSKSESSGA